MKRIFLTLWVLFLIGSISKAQKVPFEASDPFFGETCTSILVGKKASTDGSVITSHTCDGRYRTWMSVEKGQEFKNDTIVSIYKGLMKTESPWDMQNVEKAGEIPQAKQTYTFFNTAYPFLNEKQLAMGETTITGAWVLMNKKGMFQVEELQRIALQRCTTAREAIRLIGQLIKDYGYGDWGECITIADKKEVWQMEIFGEGPDKIGGVWAAQRIPDDHVGVSANIARISTINLKDKDQFMASENVFEVAKKLGLWDGKEPFKFWKAYGNTKKPYMIREFFILNALAPSKKLTMEMDELPFSVKPDKKVSVYDVLALYRETYEGTEYDMTQNLKYVKKKLNEKWEVISQDTMLSPIAHPWPTNHDRNLLGFLQEDVISFQRTVAVSWCSYSHITQLRDWLPDEIGALAWFSVDNPGQSPRIPIFSGSTQLPDYFNYCGQKRYRDDALLWQYRRANKLATLAWQETKDEMLGEVKYYEQKAQLEMKALEQKVEILLKEGKATEAQQLLNHYTKDFTGATALRWKELENFYWNKFGLGF